MCSSDLLARRPLLPSRWALFLVSMCSTAASPTCSTATTFTSTAGSEGAFEVVIDQRGGGLHRGLLFRLEEERQRPPRASVGGGIAFRRAELLGRRGVLLVGRRGHGRARLPSLALPFAFAFGAGSSLLSSLESAACFSAALALGFGAPKNEAADIFFAFLGSSCRPALLALEPVEPTPRLLSASSARRDTRVPTEPIFTSSQRMADAMLRWNKPAAGVSEPNISFA